MKVTKISVQELNQALCPLKFELAKPLTTSKSPNSPLPQPSANILKITTLRKSPYILIFVVTLISCNQNGLESDAIVEDAHHTKVHISDFHTNHENDSKNRLRFTNVLEVVQDTSANAWVEFNKNSASLALYFNLDLRGTLSVLFTTECWFYYPIKVENDKIIVYWDNYIDSKHDFDIVKAIKKIDKKYLGKPFMILELANDTTLNATYTIPEVVSVINNSSNKRILFPSKFVVTNDYY